MFLHIGDHVPAKVNRHQSQMELTCQHCPQLGDSNFDFLQAALESTLTCFLIFSFHYTNAQLRSPEEVNGGPLNEKIDVYSLGNVFYSILTGLLVNRDYTISQAHSRIRNGITEEIDVGFFESRSPAELALVKATQWCWTYDAEKRPSIFDIVDFLDEKVNKSNLT